MRSMLRTLALVATTLLLSTKLVAAEPTLGTRPAEFTLGLPACALSGGFPLVASDRKLLEGPEPVERESAFGATGCPVGWFHIHWGATPCPREGIGVCFALCAAKPNCRGRISWTAGSYTCEDWCQCNVSES